MTDDQFHRGDLKFFIIAAVHVGFRRIHLLHAEVSARIEGKNVGPTNLLPTGFCRSAGHEAFERFFFRTFAAGDFFFSSVPDRLRVIDAVLKVKWGLTPRFYARENSSKK